MVDVKLRHVTKRFGEVVAADDITLDIVEGEFFTFLGPSGCGKTTTLRLIAGLEYPDSGRIFFGDEDVTDQPPYRRGTGMVFQNYALWPHMTVYENVAYGLKIRKLPKEEIRRRVYEVLELVKLRGLENRYPTQLSGGQQQRVALARALVIRPRVLLLDEPLSNLDAKLRLEMREEIKSIQKELKITTIYVTHDQEEALAISDRIAVMNRGKVVQVGAPREVYRYPKSLFVATFLGRCTLLEGTVERVQGDVVQVRVDSLTVRGVPSVDQNVEEGEAVYVVLRSEDMTLEPPTTPHNTFTGTVEWLSFVGPYQQVRVRVNERRILASIPPTHKVEVGAVVTLHVPEESTVILKKDLAEEMAYEEVIGS